MAENGMVRAIAFRVVEDGNVRIIEQLKGGQIKKHVESDTLDRKFEDRVGILDYVRGELDEFLSNTNLPERVPSLFDEGTATGTATSIEVKLAKKKKGKK